MSFEGPRKRMVHALGVSQSVRKVKYLEKLKIEARRRTSGKKTAYSSPIFSIWNNPHSVPTSASLRSSIRLTIVAPTARAIRLLSDFRTLLIAETLFCSKMCCAISVNHRLVERIQARAKRIPETPFSVMTRSGLNSRSLWQRSLICCSSIS
jgi:hypothetical protein